MTPIEVDAEAEAELYAVGDWYRDHARPDIAPKFLQAVDRTFALISEMPKAFRVIDEWSGVRIQRALVRGFPYQVFFGEVSGVLRVFAFAHLHREPGYWRSRLNPRPPPAP